MKERIQTHYGSYELSEETVIKLLEENQRLREEQPLALDYYLKAKELELYQGALVALQKQIEARGQKVLVLFEGRDAAGKGSLIGTVSQYLNPKHCRTVALGKPTDQERSQWYFQRYVKHFPHGGEMVLFDRSWYNRAMVEPVFGFCTQEEYELFLDTVVPFEKSFIDHGVRLIKIYLSVTKQTQSERFQRRKDDPLRQWKLSEIDMQAQAMWDAFTEKKYTMLRRTHVTESPWHIIRSNNKHEARIEAMKLLLRELQDPQDPLPIDTTPNPKLSVTIEEETQR